MQLRPSRAVLYRHHHGTDHVVVRLLPVRRLICHLLNAIVIKGPRRIFLVPSSTRESFAMLATRLYMACDINVWTAEITTFAPVASQQVMRKGIIPFMNFMKFVNQVALLSILLSTVNSSEKLLRETMGQLSSPHMFIQLIVTCATPGLWETVINAPSAQILIHVHHASLSLMFSIPITRSSK